VRVVLQIPQIGDSVTTITAGSVLLLVDGSLGLLRVAVLVRYVGWLTTVTGTEIVGKNPPTARPSLRSQEKLDAPTVPIHDHHAPLGIPVRVTPAGRGSETVVRDATSIPVPIFCTVIV
jgi:hypothetical protein